jgi:hypothetical protein
LHHIKVEPYRPKGNETINQSMKFISMVTKVNNDFQILKDKHSRKKYATKYASKKEPQGAGM